MKRSLIALMLCVFSAPVGAVEQTYTGPKQNGPVMDPAVIVQDTKKAAENIDVSVSLSILTFGTILAGSVAP